MNCMYLVIVLLVLTLFQQIKIMQKGLVDTNQCRPTNEQQMTKVRLRYTV